MERLRIGIIGTGKIAKHHAAAYKYSGKAELYAASDIDQATLNTYCDEHSISHRYTDYGKMLSLDELDAVSVCVPPYLHAPITIDALRAGKHVLCEKPMCCTVEEAEQMVAASKEANCLLQIYYRYRFRNAHRKAKELIQAGELGNIYLVKATGYRFRGRPILDSENASRWFIDPEKAGAGVLFDLAGYNLDIVFWLLDFPQIKSVNAALYQEIDQDLAAAEGYAVDDHAVGMIRTVDNCCIWIERAKAVNMEDKYGGIQIFGSRAGLNPGGPILYKADSKGEMVVERLSVPEDMHRSTHMLPPKAFVESIIENKPIPDCSGQEGLYVQRILNAMLESAQKGREVALS